MLELKVIRKNKNSCKLAFLNVEREIQELWKIPNRTIISSYGRRIIHLRVFNKLYISKFVAGDLDYYS